MACAIITRIHHRLRARDRPIEPLSPPNRKCEMGKMMNDLSASRLKIHIPGPATSRRRFAAQSPSSQTRIT